MPWVHRKYDLVKLCLTAHSNVEDYNRSLELTVLAYSDKMDFSVN